MFLFLLLTYIFQLIWQNCTLGQLIHENVHVEADLVELLYFVECHFSILFAGLLIQGLLQIIMIYFLYEYFLDIPEDFAGLYLVLLIQYGLLNTQRKSILHRVKLSLYLGIDIFEEVFEALLRIYLLFLKQFFKIVNFFYRNIVFSQICFETDLESLK